MPTTYDSVACTVCGCVCDDLRVTVDAGRVTAAENACALARPWFAAVGGPPGPVARIGDTPVSLDVALGRAAAILAASRSPLIHGLSRSSTDAQRMAVALADTLGATIDTSASTGHAASIVALQEVGESTCTLGEVMQRADLIVFWGSDPLVTHPRHLERYCPPRPGRRIVVVDTRETESARAADQFVRLEPGQDWDVLTRLRQEAAGVRTSLPDPWRELAGRMKACRFGILFFGKGLARGALAYRTVAALLKLVRDLNSYTRFYARRMRRSGDVAGADAVLAWQTGYPFGVNLAAGYPRYNPGEFTSPDLLSRGEVDSCLLVGSEFAHAFPPPALAHLGTIPVIAVDPPGQSGPVAAAVSFTTAIYGVHRPGTAYRLDEVPIPLRVLAPSDAPSDGDILGELLRRVKTIAK